LEVNLSAVRRREKPTFFEEGLAMGQKLGSLLLISGSFLMLLGVALVPAAFGQSHDQSILGSGICAMSFGALLCGGGFYVKGRFLQAASPAGIAVAQQRSGGCDLCHSEVPAVLCRVHNLHICGDCLSGHYDFRSCVYVPSTRRAATSKPIARAARA
jgi:hypothetical protein